MVNSESYLQKSKESRGVMRAASSLGFVVALVFVLAAAGLVHACKPVGGLLFVVALTWVLDVHVLRILAVGLELGLWNIDPVILVISSSSWFSAASSACSWLLVVELIISGDCSKGFNISLGVVGSSFSTSSSS